MKNERYLIVLAGPTAVGKTSLSINIARKLKCDIISADSRQFFKELSIGTAKPTSAEMLDVRHHFVDFISINEEYSSGKFERATLNLLPQLFNKSHFAIMTGGSGLYIQAVCQGMNDMPDVDIRFRDSLYAELETHGLSALLEELKIKDPEYYNIVDRSNPQRIVRALEICRGTGNPYSSFRMNNSVRRDFEIIKIGLNRDRKELFTRIDQRVEDMIKAGLFEESEQFFDKRSLNALKTVGYKEIFGYLDNKYDKAEAIRLLKRNTRRYAKRQLTWFQKDNEFTWFHPDSIEEILSFIQQRVVSDI